MERRDWLKTVGSAGLLASVGGAPLMNEQRAAMRSTAQTPGSGRWPHWPFEEIHVPYRERAQRVRWPNGGPLCVYAYVTAEWDANPQLDDRKAKYTRDLRGESERSQYTYVVGIWRAIKLLDEFDIKTSIFANAGVVENYPDLFRELHSKGHEVIMRTYDQGVPTTHFTPAEERQEIRRCTDIVEKAIGQRPVGFDNPGGVCTEHTPHLLAEAGYLWMGGLKGDDLPYAIKTRSGKDIVVIGSRHTTTNDNAIFYNRGARSGRDALQYFKDFFDDYYELGQKEFPGTLNIGIHPNNSCVPDRIGFWHRAFDHMTQHRDVWFARCVDLAEYWKSKYV